MTVMLARDGWLSGMGRAEVGPTIARPQEDGFHAVPVLSTAGNQNSVSPSTAPESIVLISEARLGPQESWSVEYPWDT